jgi:ribosomal-protein-alanine N-acetyltransferase
VSPGDAERRTDRLALRRPQASDREAYEAHFTRPELQRWLRPPPLSPFDAALVEQLLAEDLGHWDDHGFGPWVLVERVSGAFAGRGGLAWTTVEDELAVELPWSMEPSLQGRGLASEAAMAAVERARELRIADVVALIIPANRPSRRVAEKTGFALERECEHAGLPHLLYRRRLGDR